MMHLLEVHGTSSSLTLQTSILLLHMSAKGRHMCDLILYDFLWCFFQFPKKPLHEK